jgi:hypothetical protein
MVARKDRGEVIADTIKWFRTFRDIEVMRRHFRTGIGSERYSGFTQISPITFAL